jgi:transposase
VNAHPFGRSTRLVNPFCSTEEQTELTQLRKEVKELRRSNDILQAAATFFGAELDRRSKK